MPNLLRALRGHWIRFTMTTPLDRMTPTELALCHEAADRVPVPFDEWVKLNLLASLPPDLRAAASAASAPSPPAIEAAYQELDRVQRLDEVDLALDEMARADEEGDGSPIFGLPPASPSAAAPPVPSAAVEAHSRILGGTPQAALSSSSTDQIHPCRFHERRYLTGFSPRDSAGTCVCPGRGGGETVCNWSGPSARSCAHFGTKVHPMPAAHPVPRQS